MPNRFSFFGIKADGDGTREGKEALRNTVAPHSHSETLRLHMDSLAWCPGACEDADLLFKAPIAAYSPALGPNFLVPQPSNTPWKVYGL